MGHNYIDHALAVQVEQERKAWEEERKVLEAAEAASRAEALSAEVARAKTEVRLPPVALSKACQGSGQKNVFFGGPLLGARRSVRRTAEASAFPRPSAGPKRRVSTPSTHLYRRIYPLGHACCARAGKLSSRRPERAAVRR